MPSLSDLARNVSDSTNATRTCLACSEPKEASTRSRTRASQRSDLMLGLKSISDLWISCSKYSSAPAKTAPTRRPHLATVDTGCLVSASQIGIPIATATTPRYLERNRNQTRAVFTIQADEKRHMPDI